MQKVMFLHLSVSPFGCNVMARYTSCGYAGGRLSRNDDIFLDSAEHYSK